MRAWLLVVAASACVPPAPPCPVEQRVEVQPYYEYVRAVRLRDRFQVVLGGFGQIATHVVRDDGSVELDMTLFADRSQPSGDLGLWQPLERVLEALPTEAGGIRVVTASRLVEVVPGSRIGRVTPILPDWLDAPSSLQLELVADTPGETLVVWSGLLGGRWRAGLGALAVDGTIQRLGVPFLDLDPPPAPRPIGVDGGWDPVAQRLVIAYAGHTRAAIVTADGTIEVDQAIDPAALCSLPYVLHWTRADVGWYGLHGSWLCHFDPFGTIAASRVAADLIGGTTGESTLYRGDLAITAIGTRSGGVRIRAVQAGDPPQLGDSAVTQIAAPYEACAVVDRE